MQYLSRNALMPFCSQNVAKMSPKCRKLQTASYQRFKGFFDEFGTRHYMGGRSSPPYSPKISTHFHPKK